MEYDINPVVLRLIGFSMFSIGFPGIEIWLIEEVVVSEEHQIW
jgi:hypothetical protein